MTILKNEIGLRLLYAKFDKRLDISLFFCGKVVNKMSVKLMLSRSCRSFYESVAWYEYCEVVI